MKNRSILWGLVCIAAGVFLAVVALILWGFGVWGPGLGSDEAGAASRTMERHFIEQMIPHHEDAVAMAQLALVRAEHPELKQLAKAIIENQTREIERMRAWYLEWYGVEVPAAADEGSGTMGGGMMHDEADLEVLGAAEVFDKEFIEQMIPHHRMGVMMAQMVLRRSDRAEIEGLARAIITTQTNEIEQMGDWYRSWFE